MADLFAWLVKEEDGREGIVCVIIPGLGSRVIPLVATSAAMIETMETYARDHADGSGKPVRLARFTEAETLRRL
jgi:hypothetical protein